jgi:hypothetical protein
VIGGEALDDDDIVPSAVQSALETLYAEEAIILELDVGERTICACLAAILKRSFSEHHVHVEYNRHGVAPKDIEYPDSDGELVQRRVFPDIIVHQPGHDDANLLVVEVKKTTNLASDAFDIHKLTHIKQKMGYRHAAFLRLPAGAGFDLDHLRIEWVD